MDYISITIKPTDACNMRCKHCYHAEDGFDNLRLPIEKIKFLLEKASEEYTRVNVLIHGGEPTLLGSKYIEEIIAIEKQIRLHKDVLFTNTLQTNGLLIDEAWIEIFRSNKINLGISFDGFHNDILRVNTDKVFRNIMMLKEKQINFAILCVETNLTIEKLIENYEWFKKYELSYKILPVFEAGYAKNHTSYFIEEKIYAEELSKFYKYWLEDAECSIRVNTVEEFLKLFITKKKLKFSSSCIGHRLGICADGSVYPCGRPYDKKFLLGKLGDRERLSDYFETEGYYNLLRINNERQEKCRKVCEYFEICGGGCISNSILDGSYTSIYGKSCMKSKLLFDKIYEINNEILAKRIVVKNPRALKIIEKF